MAGAPPSAGMAPGQGFDLMRSLNHMAPAQNPATPNSRKSDSDIIYLDNARIIESVKRALQNVADPDMEFVLSKFRDFMRDVVELKVSPSVARQGLQAAVGASGAPISGAAGLPAPTPMPAQPAQAQAPVGMMGAMPPPPGNSPPVPPAV